MGIMKCKAFQKRLRDASFLLFTKPTAGGGGAQTPPKPPILITQKRFLPSRFRAPISSKRVKFKYAPIFQRDMPRLLLVAGGTASQMPSCLPSFLYVATN